MNLYTDDTWVGNRAKIVRLARALKAADRAVERSIARNRRTLTRVIGGYPLVEGYVRRYQHVLTGLEWEVRHGEYDHEGECDDYPRPWQDGGRALMAERYDRAVATDRLWF